MCPLSHSVLCFDGTKDKMVTVAWNLKAIPAEHGPLGLNCDLCVCVCWKKNNYLQEKEKNNHTTQSCTWLLHVRCTGNAMWYFLPWWLWDESVFQYLSLFGSSCTSCLPDASGWNIMWPGCEESFKMFVASLRQQELRCLRESREHPVISWAVWMIPWSFFFSCLFYCAAGEPHTEVAQDTL